VTGPAPANSTVRVEGTVDIDDRSTSIEIETQVGEHGVYCETVPLPGKYDIGGTSVTINADDVTDGTIRSAFEGEGNVYCRSTKAPGTGRTIGLAATTGRFTGPNGLTRDDRDRRYRSKGSQQTTSRHRSRPYRNFRSISGRIRPRLTVRKVKTIRMSSERPVEVF
jgi:hypothetical protein